MKRAAALPLLLLPFLAAFAAAPEVEITAEPSHHLAVENEHVRVFQVEVAPGASTMLHRHRHDYLFVTLGDSHVVNEVADKPPVDLKLADGEAHFTPGNFAHVARNLSDRPFRNVTIELMQDEKLRTAPSPWSMEGGDKEFPGGKIRVLYIRDGARVAVCDLEPGATVPSHHHDGPHLLVAVSDLDLRSDVDGMGPMPGEFKSGDVKWLPGGYTHTLTNVGKSPAKFVTVEFPVTLVGTVLVGVELGKNGHVVKTRVVKGVRPDLDQKATDVAMRQDWTQPVSGKRLHGPVQLEVNFYDDGTMTMPNG